MRSDWIHLGEGNAHLIVGYIGDLEEYKGKALRLSKKSFSNPLFSYGLCKRFLGEKYHVWSNLINIDHILLQQLAQLGTRNQELLIGPVVLTENLLSGTLVVEIKPKWGFLPSRYNGTCRFCLHNILKTKAGLENSTFCPLDLYSGNLQRISSALESLSSTPRNNLRVFSKCIKLDHADIQSKCIELFGMEFVPVMTQVILESKEIFDNLKYYQKLWDRGVEFLERVKDHDIDLGYNIETFDIESIDEKTELMLYLLGLTLKDVSIMFLLEKGNKLKGNNDEFKQIGNLDVFCRVKIVDLDQKTMKNLKKTLELEHSLMQLQTCKKCLE